MLNAVLRHSDTRPVALARALGFACELEIRALKPGNVGLHGDGHSMTAADFLASSKAIAVPLTEPARSVGERILAAIEATRRVVPCNTNLGIVLLTAPLAHGALQCAEGTTLRAQLNDALGRLSVRDSQLAYAAIRLAKPGGLGRAARHDINDTPCVSLLEAMQEAAARDSVARQYANGFADVLDRGVPRFRESIAVWGCPEWAVTAVFLDFLSFLPDSHIVRRRGDDAAELVRREASGFAAALSRAGRPEQLTHQLQEWDHRLKREGINPGTSADLAVATVFAARIEDLIDMSNEVGACPQTCAVTNLKEETQWRRSTGFV